MVPSVELCCVNFTRRSVRSISLIAAIGWVLPGETVKLPVGHNSKVQPYNQLQAEEIVYVLLDLPEC